MAATQPSTMSLLLRLVALPPHLLADHAAGYADMVAGDLQRLRTAWQRQALLSALALCGLLVGTVLAGVAAMLWASLPSIAPQAGWVLVAVPLLPLLFAIGCSVAGRRRLDGSAFDDVRRQLRADGAMLQQASSP